MKVATHPTYTAFAGHRRIANGSLREVAVAIKEQWQDDAAAPLLVFDDAECRPVELDLRGSVADVIDRLPSEEGIPVQAPSDPVPPVSRAPGRPKLGVVAREVTLLPRHWDWLASQPGGASVALRKLVDEARKASEEPDRLRRVQEAAYRFMSAVGGNLPGFEEASRALFAKDHHGLATHCAEWPKDVCEHTLHLAGRASE